MRPLSITVAIPAMAVARTTAVIRHLDFPYPSDTETLERIRDRITGTRVQIQDLVDTIREWGMVSILRTVEAFIAHGTTQATWTTTHLHWFLTVVTWTMFLAITTCIARGIGTVIAIDFGHGSRLLARCQQAIH